MKLHDGTGLDAMLLKRDDGKSYVLVFAGTEISQVGYDCSGEKVYNYIMKGEPVSKANKWIPNTHVGSYVGHRIDVTNYTNGSAHGIKIWWIIFLKMEFYMKEENIGNNE